MTSTPCAIAYQDATVTQAATPVYPSNARTRHEATVNLIVTVGPDGKLQSARIAQSSGDMALDAAAMQAARDSQFAPKIVDCRPVSGQYLLHETLDPSETSGRPAPPMRAPGSYVPTSTSPMRYVQYCTGSRASRAVKPRTENAPAILKAARSALIHPPAGLPALREIRSLSVAMYAYAPPGDAVRTEVPQDVLKIVTPAKTMYATIRFDAAGRYTGIQPVSTRFTHFLDFMRFIAAYGLQNNLLATPVNRASCAADIAATYGSAPVVAEELEAAMKDEHPPVTSQQYERIKGALLKIDTVPRSDPNPQLTRQTLSRIGRDPKITVVYRDVPLSPSSLRELDVVRVGTNPATYAMYEVSSDGHGTIGPLPLCVVGDTRCARYYVWP